MVYPVDNNGVSVSAERWSVLSCLAALIDRQTERVCKLTKLFFGDFINKRQQILAAIVDVLLKFKVTFDTNES